MVIRDTEVDIDIINFAGVCVAMDNSSYEIKKSRLCYFKL